MRSVSAAASASRSRGRASPNRRSAPARSKAERAAFGKRKKFRTDPVSRSFRAIGRALDPRRVVFRVISALLVVVAIVALFAGGYVHRAVAKTNRTVAAVMADAGFGISAIPISGNRYTPPGEIYRSLGFALGGSIFGVDPQEARANLRRLDWVADAEIARHYPDMVYVRIVEKAPFALWQSSGGVYAVDRHGRPITQVDAEAFRRLPFFFGDAPQGASDLVAAIHAHRAVAARVKAMQRIDSRRWNLILDDGVVVKLPEDNWAREIGALERLIVDRGVLERDIAEIDLRSHDNYIFVLRHAAPSKNSRGEPT
ncbi:MAG TPA: FtsQ-type POTRA domain-containing protein [Rhizomicrobium sp.]